MFGGQLDKISLQKLLFLLTQRQEKSEYDFIPYRFGCYSYSANADMTAMVSRGYMAEDENHFVKKDTADYLKQLKPADLELLQDIKASFDKMSAADLMKYTYLNYPFYAIKSETAENLLSKKELANVEAAKPGQSETVLFTIGYEGISLEEYLVRLLKNDIKVLVDVRNNPLSMKFGFSKSQLNKYCTSLGIRYVHFPELGIPSEHRQELNTQLDYEKLFESYRLEYLPKTTQKQIEVLNLLKQHKRIALTCFEADISQCHRKHLAEAVEKLPGFTYEVKHI